MTPIKKTKGLVSLFDVGLTFEGKVLRIHLDAKVIINLDLGKVKGVHDLLTAGMSVDIQCFKHSFVRQPLVLTGALEHEKTANWNRFSGSIAISLKTISINALGMYKQVYAAPSLCPRTAHSSPMAWSRGRYLQSVGQNSPNKAPMLINLLILGALMAGAHLSAAFSIASLGAYFDAQADFRFHFSPLRYQAEVAVTAGVSYGIKIRRFIKKFSASIGVRLELKGPPLGDTVYLEIVYISFSVDFRS
ncbi:hypothetical protein CSUB01_09131 [Colletotrichum sublineola]|uniref:DUF6603 domain-containing protein n=1 Tax=Colletotrichum sublineola TaxID=1173701 RepID=A0A066XWB3_COLSU|nr:hypothetical protein CSUB01_09131 [Colletotrichum sublineola]